MALPHDPEMFPVLHCGAADMSRLVVMAMHGTEELNKPYRFVVDLRSEPSTSPSSLDFSAVVGAVASVRFQSKFRDILREMPCVITEASHVGTVGDEVQIWRLVLHSPLWLLSLNRQFRTFENRSVSDVVNQVIGEYPLTANIESTSFAPSRIIQHGESDLDLISRLLADEGMLWRTELGDGTGMLFTAGDHQRLSPTDTETVAHYAAGQAGADTGGGAVTEFLLTRRATLSKFKFSAQAPGNPERPAEDEAPVASPKITVIQDAVRTISNHHGGMRNASDAFPARAPAGILADRAVALASQAKGRSNLYVLGAGTSLKITGHAHADVTEDSWVVTSVEHRWGEPGATTSEDEPANYEGGSKGSVYTNRFTCIPFSGPPLRAPLSPPPVLPGLRLGVITDNNLPGGDDDEPGGLMNTAFYEVEFPSEPTRDGTPFVQRMRLALPWAGPQRGLHFPLEVGDEVVVAHEHGDPARPFIIGSLFSDPNQGPQVSSQGGKATSGVLRSRTGHELRYDEEDGAGKITLRSAAGEHDLVLDDGGASTSLTSQGTFTASASSDATVSAGEKLNLTATGDAKLTTDAAGTITSAGVLAISSSGDEITITSPSKISLIVGGSSIVIEPAKITLASAEIGVNGTSTATVAAPTAQFGKAGGATTVIGATVGIDGSTSATMSSPASTVTATGEAVLHGATVTISGSGAVAISGSSVGING